MQITDNAHIECKLLKNLSDWKAGFYQEQHIFSGKTRNQQPILSLNVEKASKIQKEIALKILDDWGINAVVKISNSEKAEVIRIQGHNDCNKLRLATFMCDPKSWILNQEVFENTFKNMMNICIQDLGQEFVDYMKQQLKRIGIESKEVISYSLAEDDSNGILVLRINEEYIPALNKGFAVFRMVDAPDYPKNTHYLDRQKNGIVIIRKKQEGIVGKIDNPIGPAVVTMEDSNYFQDGMAVSKEKWEQLNQNSLAKISI